MVALRGNDEVSVIISFWHIPDVGDNYVLGYLSADSLTPAVKYVHTGRQLADI